MPSIQRRKAHKKRCGTYRFHTPILVGFRRRSIAYSRPPKWFFLCGTSVPLRRPPLLYSDFAGARVLEIVMKEPKLGRPAECRERRAVFLGAATLGGFHLLDEQREALVIDLDETSHHRVKVQDDVHQHG